MTPSEQQVGSVAWSEGEWTHPPLRSVADGADLVVNAAEGSDAWRVTSYGFVHESEHALVVPFAPETAVEVSFTADLPELFDQAGVFVVADAHTWVKAGVERADGQLQLGAVVTNPRSDWSVSPVPDWVARRVVIRVSRGGDALTVRARVADEAFRLVRVVPLDPALALRAGPYVCAPTRGGLQVRFHSWEITGADGALH